MNSTDSVFGLVPLLFKISFATLVNYGCLLIFQSADGWLGTQRAIPYLHVTAGVTFLTILLLGAAGALSTFLAIVLQHAQLYDSNEWLIFFAYASASVVLQYAVIKVCLYMFGLAPTLEGLSHFHLIALSVIFSVTYTLTTTFILHELRNIVLPTIAQTAFGDFLGIITCFGILKLLGSLRKQFFPGTSSDRCSDSK